ncbi:MAG TPA: TetR/AcrR family transcriptional regulator [Phenylobacterium sp.]|nr:TetR/AcrR family transcriptional regulator [Phenylobacterium sp.]
MSISKTDEADAAVLDVPRRRGRPPNPRGNRQGTLTRTKILKAAERLFGERGYDGVSLREITAAAGVDLALINYHFQTKENLFAQVLARRSTIVARDRFSRLDAARAEGRALTLDAILAAFFDPIFERLARPSRGWRAYGRLIAQVTIEQRHVAIVTQEHDPTARTFIAALGEVLPTLSKDTLIHGYLLMIGAMIQYLAQTDRLVRLSDQRLPADDFATAEQMLTDFVRGGLRELEAGSRRGA